MILTTDARERLMNLAPRVLFHGTRFAVPIMAHDELAYSRKSHLVHLTTCPEEAAEYASGPPRPWDCGRGALLALDWGLLDSHDFLSCPLQEGWSPTEWVCDSIYPLRNYVVGCYWLDELTPGAGIARRLHVAGPVAFPAHPWHAVMDLYDQRLEAWKARGVESGEMKPFFDFKEGAVYGLGLNGLERHRQDSVYAPMLAGMRLDPIDPARNEPPKPIVLEVVR